MKIRCWLSAASALLLRRLQCILFRLNGFLFLF